MNRDDIDDAGKPFEPETPEEFFQRGCEAFEEWWTELDPQGVCRGVVLDRETARAVWSAAYEHSAACIGLIYDGAASHARSAPMCQAELTCAVHRHHNGSISLPVSDFRDWVEKHEDHIRRDFVEDEHDPNADRLTIWIDREKLSPPVGPVKRTPPHTSAAMRASADEQFTKWWQTLEPPATYEWIALDRERAVVTWREAYCRLWDDLEVVHDSAKAYGAVLSETASLELGYIIDRFHDGSLSLPIDNVTEYWDDDRYLLERHRTDERISLHVRCFEQGTA